MLKLIPKSDLQSLDRNTRCLICLKDSPKKGSIVHVDATNKKIKHLVYCGFDCLMNHITATREAGRSLTCPLCPEEMLCFIEEKKILTQEQLNNASSIVASYILNHQFSFIPPLLEQLRSETFGSSNPISIPQIAPIAFKKNDLAVIDFLFSEIEKTPRDLSDNLLLAFIATKFGSCEVKTLEIWDRYITQNKAWIKTQTNPTELKTLLNATSKKFTQLWNDPTIHIPYPQKLDCTKLIDFVLRHIKDKETKKNIIETSILTINKEYISDFSSKEDFINFLQTHKELIAELKFHILEDLVELKNIDYKTILLIFAYMKSDIVLMQFLLKNFSYCLSDLLKTKDSDLLREHLGLIEEPPINLKRQARELLNEKIAESWLKKEQLPEKQKAIQLKDIRNIALGALIFYWIGIYLYTSVFQQRK